MALNSPMAVLFENILQRIVSMAPEIRYIEQDMGQLENYEMRPPVSWPCALIDIEEASYEDLSTHLGQTVNLLVSIRIGLVKYTDASNLTPTILRERALQFYEVEQKVFLALHGWASSGFSKMLRRAAVTERRNDDIRVRELKFAVSFTDTSAKPATTNIDRAAPLIGVTKP